MSNKIDLEKKYGKSVKAFVGEAGLLGMFDTTTLKTIFMKLQMKQNKTKEDEDNIEVIKEMIKQRSENE